MKKILVILLLICMILPLTSAETTIIFNKQPKSTYSIGDSIALPITLKSLSSITGILNLDLICDGKQTNFYKNGVKLSAGEEQRMNPILILTKENIGVSMGTCTVKAMFDQDYELTNEFSISNLLVIDLQSGQGEYAPEEEILIQGGVTKENGEAVNGLIELNLVEGNESQQSYTETINNGFFSFSLTMPIETKAGPHLIRLKAYENDFAGEITNEGFFDFNLQIKQVPTNLEIIVENPEIDPGESFQIKGVLHDQTGENIASSVVITIKDSKDKILDQQELATEEIFEYPTKYNQPSANFTIYAISNQLESQSTCSIREKESIEVEIKNKTLSITNNGNVLYNGSVLVKIGEEPVNIDTFLEIDESKEYVLKGPEGEHEIEVIDKDGQSKITGNVMLTGGSIDVKESGKIIRYPIIWIFMILILGLVAFLAWKKGYQKTFIGYVKKKIPEKLKKKTTSKKPAHHSHKPSESSLKHLEEKNKAHLSLSIKGNKQDANVICLKIKNPGDIDEKKGNTKETIDRVISTAESKKAVLYQTEHYLFFIFAPVMTKTFKNEKSVVGLGHEIKKILDDHNRLFQHKIRYGIGLNHGQIIAQKDGEKLKFSSLDDLITKAKKIASISFEEVLLSEKINNRLRSSGGFETEKSIKHGTSVYIVKRVRDREKNSAFVKSFLDRLDKEKKEKH